MPRAKAGESVRGYKLLKDFKMAGGGNCEWTFATKDEKDYFIKVFLNPKYPKPDGPGNPETKRLMVEDCERFEKHQRKLNEAVKRVAGTGGRLVAAHDFFREDNLFYKVAVKVPVTPISTAQISKLPIASRIKLLQNVTTAVQSLHNQRIVHGDLKVDNALLEKGSEADTFVARLIDFDSSYFSGEPFIVDEMVGDPPYYSPELLNYVQKRDTSPSSLTTKSDIFALGIVFHQYLTGEMPSFPNEYQYTCEAVRAGHAFPPESLKSVGGDGLASLISQMLALNPADRPDAFSVLNKLRVVRGGGDITEPTPKPPPGGPIATPPVVPPVEKKPERKGLRGTLVEETKEKPTPELAPDSGGGRGEVPPTPPAPPVTPPPSVPKPGLRVSDDLKSKSGGEGASPTSGGSSATDTAPPADTVTPTSPVASLPIDLALPSTYRVALTDLISSLRNLETVVGEKTSPPDAPPRVKGSLRHAPRSLSPGETESLSDIALRLEELQKYATDIVSWFKGDTSDRPPLLGSKSDLEVTTTSESAPVRVEVESRSDEGSMPTVSYADIDESTPIPPSDLKEPALTVTTDPEPLSVASTVTVLTAPETTPVASGADPSGNHRREERLRNRALDADKRPPRA